MTAVWDKVAFFLQLLKPVWSKMTSSSNNDGADYERLRDTQNDLKVLHFGPVVSMNQCPKLSAHNFYLVKWRFTLLGAAVQNKIINH